MQELYAVIRLTIVTPWDGNRLVLRLQLELRLDDTHLTDGPEDGAMGRL